MTTHSLKPNFGVNYDVGYIGFTARSCDPVSAGIAWFERWDSPIVNPPGHPPGVIVTHALVVSGADECIEAHAQVGVHRGTLSQYFNDPHCQIFFRKPRGWTLQRGIDIANSAAKHLGDRYGYGVIFADLLANSLVGHWINSWTAGIPNRVVCRWLNRAGAEVCSQLAGMAMQDQDWVSRQGCLAEPPAMITPQALFEDDPAFAPWKNISPIQARHA